MESLQGADSDDNLHALIHKRVRFHLPDDKPEDMLHCWQKQQPINKRGSRLSWLLRFCRRRPLTALFVSTAVLAGSVPCMAFLGFVFVTFLISFVVFVMAESSLVGAGLFALVLVLSVPLCCAAASTACLVACWWAVSYLQDSLSNMAEPAETAFHYLVGLYVPRRIKNIIYAF
ncbi:hypothetical protein OS493_037264 [Desmophyllum pertusum]|uniref:Uncharacterized protein n=1 Tax=Desmophyllum pertusum TaxID=174260 RepID=A0A9W9YUF1_9CNID|nr:hypothetical protein OS493_037264 [Desmophyllum pertusum]